MAFDILRQVNILTQTQNESLEPFNGRRLTLVRRYPDPDDQDKPYRGQSYADKGGHREMHDHTHAKDDPELKGEVGFGEQPTSANLDSSNGANNNR